MDIYIKIGLFTVCFQAALSERSDLHCCEHVIEDKCRKACLRSHRYNLLTAHCDATIETDFLSCTRRTQETERCCGSGMRSNMTVSCHNACKNIFAQTPPNPRHSLDEIKQLCPTSTFRCAKTYFMEIRTHSSRGSICCNEATSAHCKVECKSIMHQKLTEEQKIDKIIKSCGQPVPRKPLWKCLLSNTGQNSQSPPRHVGPNSHCCTKAMSPNCRQLCQDLYSGPWTNSKNWQRFRKLCELNPEESSLNSCLQEVKEPCMMGCSDLQFCTNMNDRPAESFHSCNAVADSTARALVRQWKRGTIKLAFADIPVLDIDSCQPEKWKAVACVLEVKPCGAKKGGTTICRSQCVSLLQECADVARFDDGLTIDWICDMFSPGHLQHDCISLDKYTVATSAKPVGVITQPCIPNPCGHDRVCVVNREKCDTGRKDCLPYKCLSACSVGQAEHFLVYVGQRTKLRDFERGDGCYLACACTIARKLEYCSDLPCMDQRRHCEVAGQIKAHGKNFNVDCNFCSCYNGEVICTKRQCSLSSENSPNNLGTSTLLPCNCNSHHLPVCAANGRTYPNICHAKCMGFRETEIEFGQCSAKDPCQARPCRRNEKCIPAYRVCLTSSTYGCPQFECLSRYSNCMRRRTRRQSYASDGNHHVDSYLLNSASKRKTSPSLMFSYDLSWHDQQPVCDITGVEHSNICYLRRKYRNATSLAYRGKCKSLCTMGKSNRVCGIDGITYQNMCVAEASRILVDYVGTCRFEKNTKDSRGEKECTGISCSSLAHPDCVTVIPPGSCCHICAGMIRLLYSQSRLDSAAENSIHGPVAVRDVIRSLRRHTNVKECDIYGHLTTEGDIAVLVISTEKPPTILQIEACQQETVRLGRLVNQQSPIFHSDLILSTLTAAEIHGMKDCSRATSSFSFNSFNVLLAFILVNIFG